MVGLFEFIVPLAISMALREGSDFIIFKPAEKNLVKVIELLFFISVDIFTCPKLKKVMDEVTSAIKINFFIVVNFYFKRCLIII